MITLTQAKYLPKVLTFGEIKYYIFTFAFTASAVFIPWLFHQFNLVGPQFLPMHYFVILAGILFGWRTGLIVGLLSPLMSYGLTHLPPLMILPEVTLELAVYGLTAGLLREKKFNIWISLLGAMVLGRLARLFFVLSLGFHTDPIGYFKMSLAGTVLQIILIPLFVFVLAKFLKDERAI